MTRKFLMIAASAAVALATGLVMTSPARAQSGAVAAAMSAGTVGEQADGYLGITGSASEAVRPEVESINIKRTAAYTHLAGQRGVPVQDVSGAKVSKAPRSRGDGYSEGGGRGRTDG